MAVKDSPSFTFGRYELFAKLGEGGMGEIFLARQRMPRFTRTVVVKVMRPDISREAQATAMFHEEMRVLASVHQHNVVQIIEGDEIDGTLFMVMEYIPGVTLLSVWAQLVERGHRCPPDVAAALLSQACRGLHAAHELRDEHGRPRGLVHRDVSPHNLLVTPEGDVKVLDFGIAWAKNRLVEATTSPQIKGKLAYMSPEQACAQPLTRASDIFSVGVILHELVSGQRLFKRDDALATLAAVCKAEAPPLALLRPEAPHRLTVLVEQALQVDPHRRPPTAAYLADELDEVVRDAGGQFIDRGAVAGYLVSLGVNLDSPPPTPLDGPPWFVRQTRPTAPEAGRKPKPAPAPEKHPPDGSAGPGDTDLLSITAPEPGKYIDLPLSGGERLIVQSLHLDPRESDEPVQLVFASDPGILPVPLLLQPSGAFLQVEIDREASARTGVRASLYVDANQPNTRRETFHIPRMARGGCFDVGHRKAQVHRVFYESGAPDGDGAVSVPVPAVRASIVARDTPRQLAVLYAVGGDGKVMHMACVNVYS
jgi:serine/threonine protein kinase